MALPGAGYCDYIFFIGQDSMERLHQFDEIAYDAMRSLTGNLFSEESVS